MADSSRYARVNRHSPPREGSSGGLLAFAFASAAASELCADQTVSTVQALTPGAP